MKRRGEVYGMLAEFDAVEPLRKTAVALLIDGYRHVRIYAPYPVKEVSGLFSSTIGKMKTLAIAPAVFAGGAGGAVIAFLMQVYASAVAYPLNVGGRPYVSWPSFIPVTFELSILGAAVMAAVTMLVLNSLPQFHHPLFNAPRFERATQDRFFICVEERDRKFDREKTAELLREHALAVEEVPW